MALLGPLARWTNDVCHVHPGYLVRRSSCYCSLLIIQDLVGSVQDKEACLVQAAS